MALPLVLIIVAAGLLMRVGPVAIPSLVASIIPLIVRVARLAIRIVVAVALVALIVLCWRSAIAQKICVVQKLRNTEIAFQEVEGRDGRLSELCGGARTYSHDDENMKGLL